MQDREAVVDRTGWTWTSPAMLAALAADDVGAVIRLVRRATNINQTELGRRCGYSVSTISRIERGQPPCQDIHVRRRIAEVLKIPAQYVGLATMEARHSSDTPRVDIHPNSRPPVRVGASFGGRGDPVRRRDLLSGLAGTAAATAWPLPVKPVAGTARLADLLGAAKTDLPSAGLNTLTNWLDSARKLFAGCRYDHLTECLVTFIADAAAAREQAAGGDRERAGVLLAAGYRLASELCVKRNEDALAWVLADRALAAARDSGHARSVAHASRSVAIAMRRAGHHHDAVALLSTSAQQLLPAARPSDAALATYGSLLCTASYASAQGGDRDRATVLIAEATETAARVAGAVSLGEITFSPTNVSIYKIGIYTALGDSGAALTHAGEVDPRELDSSERYARYCIDTARAWALHGRPDRATHALHAAERCAPQELRRPSSLDLVTRLLYAPTVTPSGLRNLARRIGALT